MHLGLAHHLVIVVGHGREQIAPRAFAVAYRVIELLECPVADTGLPVGGDVGGIDHAERRLDRQAAGERLACLAVAVIGVARHAVGEFRQVFAALDFVGLGRCRAAERHRRILHRLARDAVGRRRVHAGEYGAAAQ
jgi:hypothetical protein